MQPPPSFRSENPNELGHTQPSGWSGLPRLLGWSLIVLAVLSLPVAWFFGPWSLAVTLLTVGVFLVSMIFLPRNLKFTPSGGVWALLSGLLLIAGFVAMYHDNNLLLWLAYGAAALPLLNGLAVGWGLDKLCARRHISQPIFAQTPFVVEVEVHNPAQGDLWGVQIEEKGSTHTQPYFCVRLEGRGRRVLRHEIELPYRGTYFWGPLVVSSSYPFGLIECRLLIPPAEKTLVLPALGHLHRGRLRRFLRGADPKNVRIRQRPKVHRAAQDEFHGLRPYRIGDSPRWIHWRTSARRGELMVREFEDRPSENLLLVFDPTLILNEENLPIPIQIADRRWLREQYEQAVNLVATLVWEWCRRRGNRLIFAFAGKEVLVFDGPTTLAHAYTVLEYLAKCRPNRVQGSPVRDEVTTAVEKITTWLHARPMPAYSAMIVTIEASALVEPLQNALNRPVNWVDVTTLPNLDFYEPPKYIPWDA